MVRQTSMENIINKIDKYLLSNTMFSPFMLNVENQEDYIVIKDILVSRTDVSLKFLSELCNSESVDYEPKLEDIIEYICKSQKTSVVFGLTQYLKFLGNQRMEQLLSQILGCSTKCKMVIVCYQCARNFERICAEDIRRERFMRSTTFEETFVMPEITFLREELAGQNELKGFQSLLYSLEVKPSIAITIATNKKKSDFPNTLYPITELDDVFESINMMFFDAVRKLKKSNGSLEQWSWLYTALRKQGNYDTVLKSELGDSANLDHLKYKWKNWSIYQRWLYFIALKQLDYYGDSYLVNCANNAASLEKFQVEILREILLYPPEADRYNQYYNERKEIMDFFSFELDAIIECWDYTKSKVSSNNVINYLTNKTSYEKERVISCLAEYEYTESELKEILKRIYPQLADYLNDYVFNVPLLDSYFNEYKLQKIRNRMSNDFMDKVRENARKREYNRILPFRSEELYKIDVNNAECFL